MELRPSVSLILSLPTFPRSRAAVHLEQPGLRGVGNGGGGRWLKVGRERVRPKGREV